VAYQYQYYPELPWSVSAEDEARFRRVTRWVLVATLIASVVIPFLPVPEEDRTQVKPIPPRLAKLILEQKKKPPPPKVIKKKEIKPKKKVAKKKTRPKEKKKVESARRRAQKAGLLAVAGELAALRDDSLVASAFKDVKKSDAGKRARTPKRSVITSNAARGSGGIDTAALSRSTGGQGLAGRQTTRVASAIPGGETGGARRGGRKGGRSIEEIRLVFDRNKSAIYNIYYRALRRDPSLQGKVVLELTIAPSGRVTRCRILSSEIQSPELKRKLVARVKLFNFGSKPVDTVRVTYPIEFFPS